eukprot:scaffold17504_cov68-Phaeocystis_antarctica.AAC.2
MARAKARSRPTARTSRITATKSAAGTRPPRLGVSSGRSSPPRPPRGLRNVHAADDSPMGTRSPCGDWSAASLGVEAAAAATGVLGGAEGVPPCWEGEPPCVDGLSRVERRVPDVKEAVRCAAGRVDRGERGLGIDRDVQVRAPQVEVQRRRRAVARVLSQRCRQLVRRRGARDEVLGLGRLQDIAAVLVPRAQHRHAARVLCADAHGLGVRRHVISAVECAWSGRGLPKLGTPSGYPPSEPPPRKRC